MKKMNNTYSIITAFAIIALVSCKPKAELNDTTYSLISTNDPRQDSLSYSIVLKKNHEGIEILKEKSYGVRPSELRKTILKKRDRDYYEYILIKDFDRKTIDTVSVLFLSHRDTSFVYTFDADKYPPVAPIGSLDYKYIIKKLKTNQYQTEKINMADSTFSETIIYDENFNALEFSIKEANRYYMFKSKKQ